MERNYYLDVGDVVLIQHHGHGFTKKDVGKYVEITGYGNYFGDTGATVKEYDKPIETVDYGDDDGVVGYGSFGDKPMILFNINDEHTVDEEHAVVAVGSKEETDKILGIDRSAKRDMGKHYRYSFRLNLTPEDIENGFVMVNLDPYRISTVYNLGGWREHLVKKGIRGTEKGHTEKELLDELQCILDRAKQMYEESCE